STPGLAHTVVIDWQDGTSDTLNLAAGVSTFGPASHTYTEEKATPFTVTVTVTNTSSGSGSATQAVTVNDAPLTSVGGDLKIGFSQEGASSSNLSVATFLDANPNAPISDFTASINWGDSTTSPGTVIADSGGGFGVLGSHTYAEESAPNANFKLNVTITDKGGSTITIG